MLDKVKQALELKKKMGALQRQLAAEEVAVEERGIRIVITGDQKIREVSVKGKDHRDLADVLNKAIRESQKIAAQKLQEMSGGLSGLMGKLGGF